MTKDDPVEPPRPPESLRRHESGLIQRVRAVIDRAFPSAPPHLVAGYSGGRDSLALLLVLRELKRLRKCRLTVAHVDHGLRSSSSEDAERAVEVGRDLGVEVQVLRPEVSLVERYPGRSIEDVARTFRYRMLKQTVDEVDGDAIAVAHHARDQAETVLLHLLRGSGLSGLAGMAADTLLPVPDSSSGAVMRVIRPFLHESPEMIAELVDRSGVPVIEDFSNTDPRFRRNRIRHELLPLLEGIASGATGRLVSLSDIVREDDTALGEVAHILLERSMDDKALVWASLQEAPRGVQRRVVRQWLRRYSDVGDVSRERVDAVMALGARGEGGKRVEVGQGWHVQLVRGRLVLAGPNVGHR